MEDMTWGYSYIFYSWIYSKVKWVALLTICTYLYVTFTFPLNTCCRCSFSKMITAWHEFWDIKNSKGHTGCVLHILVTKATCLGRLQRTLGIGTALARNYMWSLVLTCCGDFFVLIFYCYRKIHWAWFIVWVNVFTISTLRMCGKRARAKREESKWNNKENSSSEQEEKHFGEVCLWTQLKIIIVKTQACRKGLSRLKGLSGAE